MGEAFKNVKTGSGYAYFPAVSLSRNEHLRANFGATPLRYPIEGYEPLQAMPQEDVVKSQLLIGWLEKLTNTLIKEDKVNCCQNTKDQRCVQQRECLQVLTKICVADIGNFDECLQALAMLNTPLDVLIVKKFVFSMKHVLHEIVFVLGKSS